MKHSCDTQSLYGTGIYACVEGLNLTSITNRDPKGQAICHLLLRSPLPHTVVNDGAWSLTQHHQKAAFSKRLFSDYHRFLADCSVCDTLYPSQPILVRTVQSARPLCFGLSYPAHTRVANLGALRDFDGVLQLQFADCAAQLLLAFRGDVIWDGEALHITGSATLAFGFCTAAELDKTLCRMATFSPNIQEATQVSMAQAIFSLLAARVLPDGSVCPRAVDCVMQEEVQAQVLSTFCRLAKKMPQLKETASRIYGAMPIPAPTPRASQSVIAAIRYADLVKSPVPSWCESVLCENANLLLGGAMPFDATDGLAYPICEHGSLTRTVQWLFAADSYLATVPAGDGVAFLQEKAEVVRATLFQNFYDGQWQLSSPLRAASLRKSHRYLGVCPICYDRAGDVTVQTLCYDKVRATYLCPHCLTLDLALPPLRLPPLFDGFGYCAVPKEAGNSFCALLQRAFAHRQEKDMEKLQKALDERSLDTLSTVDLAYLALLFQL